MTVEEGYNPKEGEETGEENLDPYEADKLERLARERDYQFDGSNGGRRVRRCWSDQASEGAQDLYTQIIDGD